MPGYSWCLGYPCLALHTTQTVGSWTSLLILCCVAVSTPIVMYPITPLSMFSPSSGTIWTVGSQPLAVSEAKISSMSLVVRIDRRVACVRLECHELRAQCLIDEHLACGYGC